MAWTISSPLGLCVGVQACGGTTHRVTDCCCSCIRVKSSAVTWHHSNSHNSARPSFSQATHMCCQVLCCHVHTSSSHCCELVDSHVLSMHRSRVLVPHRFSLPAYTWVYFATFSAMGMGVGLYAACLYASIYGNASTVCYCRRHVPYTVFLTVCACICVSVSDHILKVC